MSLVTSILSSPLLLAALHLSEGAEGEGGGLPLAVVPIIIFVILALIFLSSYFSSSGIQSERAAETADSHDDHTHDIPDTDPSEKIVAEPVTRTAALQTEVVPTAITEAPEMAVVVTEERETAVTVPEEKETAVVIAPDPNLEPMVDPEPEPISKSEPEPEIIPAKPDDLKIVEGIGPKIEGILHDAGILTYAQLAAASVAHLEKVVREEGGVRVAYPDTWPEQAQLAADGLWDALEKLQDNLKGGRRV